LGESSGSSCTKDIILAGLAHSGYGVLLSREIISKGTCFDAFSVTGHTLTIRNGLFAVLAVEGREESVESGSLEARFDYVFHAPIIPHPGRGVKNYLNVFSVVSSCLVNT
jgi:hypothetical protein